MSMKPLQIKFPTAARAKALAAMQAAYDKLDSVAFVSHEGDTEEVKSALLDAIAAMQEGKTMTKVLTDTRKALSTNQTVQTAEGKGVIQEIREDCEYPIFVRFSDGRVNAFTQHEVK
ncbi:hypothetical protein [Pseudomonas sp. MWU12-2323]|uniref:hypothetical protein n=1 Tax=Pseudomonas sp. MWU12-2323 TaxID=2651296 RepID=UPI00128E520E|nr:hypothetical protein [Pseudomonas sp. MWU12-2323]MPQ69493.1 hypothetical protein [Pseudomonas sp. MWU12-2323]